MKKKINELNDLLKKYQKQRNKYNDFLIVEKKKIYRRNFKNTKSYNYRLCGTK